jgi:tRNA(adenine34) deaminase
MTDVQTGDIFNPHQWYMRKALALARKAAAACEVPVGAVIMHGDRLIAQAYNQVELLKDPTAHAEMIAITQAAAALGDWRLDQAVMYVTKEPCPMCAGAIVLARLKTVVWGVSDPLRGGAISRFQILQSETLNHRVECLTGVLEDECREVIQEFFRRRRAEGEREQISDTLRERMPPGDPSLS